MLFFFGLGLGPYPAALDLLALLRLNFLVGVRAAQLSWQVGAVDLRHRAEA